MHPLAGALAVAALMAGVATAGSAAPNACDAADDVPTAATLDVAEAATVCLVNAERATAGLPPLAATDALRHPATSFADEMVAEQTFAHTLADGRTLEDRLAGYTNAMASWSLGENIGWGEGVLGTPRRVVADWMASTGHRENILSPVFRDIGVGIAPGAPEATDRPSATYTADFGTRTAPVAPLADAVATEPATPRRQARPATPRSGRVTAAQCTRKALRRLSKSRRRARQASCARRHLRILR